jgi:LysR family glycine cleavage system transcriptional activator
LAYRLPALSTFRTFEAAVRHRSFAKAAQELSVTPAAVSQQMKKLESHLGVLLFVRGPNALQLTEDGLAMYPKIREGLESFAAGVEATRHRLRQTLNVTVPPAFATRWLIPRLARFSVACPEVSIRITSHLGNIDGPDNASAPTVALIDPRSETSEVAIRFGTGLYPDYQVEKMFTPDYVVACSPSLCHGDPPLRQPSDLSRHILIHDESIPAVEHIPNWQAWLRLAGVSGIDTGRGLRFSNAILALEAAIDGQGVAFVHQPHIEADLVAGRLVMPFALRIPSLYSYYLLTSRAATGQPVVLAFQQWLAEEIGQGTGL